MKKLIMTSLLALVAIATIQSCSDSSAAAKSGPKLSYDCGDYFSKDDWELSYNASGDTITNCEIDKKFLLKSDLFRSAKDSIEIGMNLTKAEFDRLPPQGELRMMITKSLIESKYGCKNEATFNPFKISIGFITDDETKKESLYIITEFLASNAYGTPGELKGYFKFDLKSLAMTHNSVME